MLDDANKVPRGTTIRTDVCIVGAGAAGITIARELAGGSRDVVLLESGGFEFEAGTQGLYNGPTSGIPYDLDATRLRYFGGTTNHWGGYCRPLDESDFEARDWVPGSGWPFGRNTLLPYYERAQPMCDLGPFRYDLPYWLDRFGDVQPLLEDGDTVETALFQISGGARFGTKYRKPIVKAKNVRLLLHANVVNVRSVGGRVAGVDVRTLDGNRFGVEAQVVVLASGGIENTRLLLVSRDTNPAGLGNDHDLVGRYFMDHSLVRVGRLVLSDAAPDPELSFFVGLLLTRAGIADLPGGYQRTLLGMLALTPAAAQAARVPAFCVQLFQPGANFGGSIEDRDIVGLVGDVEGRHGGRAPITITYFGGDTATVRSRFDVAVNMEPTPSRDSRVTLTDRRDELGLPRVHLNWAFDPADWHSMEHGVEILAREFGRRGLGRMHRLPAEGLDVEWGNHHMGTTRMDADPSRGVVDANCEVHGVANLYIASSSVFPAVGFSNPTLTIVALALRMAERIQQVLAA